MNYSDQQSINQSIATIVFVLLQVQGHAKVLEIPPSRQTDIH